MLKFTHRVVLEETHNAVQVRRDEDASIIRDQKVRGDRTRAAYFSTERNKLERLFLQMYGNGCTVLVVFPLSLRINRAEQAKDQASTKGAVATYLEYDEIDPGDRIPDEDQVLQGANARRMDVDVQKADRQQLLILLQRFAENLSMREKRKTEK